MRLVGDILKAATRDRTTHTFIRSQGSQISVTLNLIIESLYELKKELENAIITTNHKIDSYSHVASAAKRSLDFISSNTSCENDCWPVLVDFMHASQWQSVSVKRSTYENMRRMVLPRKVSIIDAVEANHAQVDAAVQAFSDKPYYRALIRQLISNEVQEFYWHNCYSLNEGIEAYNLNCPKGIADDLAHEMTQAIVQNPEIKPHLTQWFGTAVLLPISLEGQNSSAKSAIAIIDAELKLR